MPRGLPDVGVHYYRRIETNNVFTAVDKVFPPSGFDIVFQLHAQRPEVEKTVEAAVNFGGAKDKPSAFAKAFYNRHVEHKESLMLKFLNKEAKQADTFVNNSSIQIDCYWTKFLTIMTACALGSKNLKKILQFGKVRF